MYIERDSQKLGDLFPEAVVILSSLDSSVLLYHNAHSKKRRHPLGTYNISWQSILLNFSLVLREMKSVMEAISISEPAHYQGSGMLGHCQSNLLRSIDEHFEECTQILHALFAPGENCNGNPHVKAFNDAIKTYRDHVRAIVNCLKHEQGRIRTAVLIFPEAPSFPGQCFLMPTYNVEVANDQGIPGPSPKFHSEPAEAFSYYYDLKYHLCNLYIASHYLADAIVNIVGEQNFNPLPNINATKTPFAEIAYAIASLPDIFLKHEKNGNIPSVKIYQMENMLQIALEFPAKGSLPIFDLGKRSIVVIDWLGDGITKSQRLPFKPSHPFPPEDK